MDAVIIRSTITAARVQVWVTPQEPLLSMPGWIALRENHDAGDEDERSPRLVTCVWLGATERAL